jgi:glyoxylase-like metal-dependent hydrolase (beta-lactamase superfamily II)
MTRYRCTLLRAGEFRLDAGSMFGLIPRVVWSRTVPTDDRNRVTLQHNCLLLERLDEPPAHWKGPAPKLVLLEAGTGDKLDDKSRELFAMDGRSIVDALREVGCRPEDIGAVIPSHLHFDHAGGVTRLARAGEQPDWRGHAGSFGAPRPDHAVKLTFPQARLITQKREWADALANRSVMTRTYFDDHLHIYGPKQAGEGLLQLVECPAPFSPGVVPDKTSAPLPAHAREVEVLPGVFVFLAPGHTWGQQATRFTDAKGRSVIFTPDVIPTAWHLGQAYSLAYDVEPYTSMVTRTWLLRHAAEQGCVLMLDHEPGHPFFAVRANAKGWYDLEKAEA